MAYEGEILNACGVIQIDFSDTYIVAVSGDGPNICGHLLIYSAKGGGFYFHVTGDTTASGIKKFRGYLMYMNDVGYRRHLKETGKRELRRRKVELPNSSRAFLIYRKTACREVGMGIIATYCISFVEAVIEVGGGS
jgi:hypothetical protein